MSFLHAATLLLVCIYQFVSPAFASSERGSFYSASTCPSRTINYITHGLPQQCLTSSRSLSASVTSTDAVDATTTDEASRTNTTSVIVDQITTTPFATASLANEDSTISSLSTEAFITSTTKVASTPVEAVVTVLRATDPAILRPAQPPVLIEEDSPLENENFLSFQDWKKQNLIKAGQSEHVGKDANAEPREGRKRLTAVHDSLDSLGDDVEIELDFSGLVSDRATADRVDKSQSSVRESAETQDGPAPRARTRSKDAGTTYKERFNYASFDCAANVLKTNPQARSSSSVLGENKDAYMLNECSAENKFIILELCNDISVDTVVLANFEFFSSIFRTFRVSVSDRYPVKVEKWQTLGTFEARNTREVQAFLIENSIIWARYLRIEFLTHYGNEYYCPLSLVRVHGTTMLEEYKHDLEMSMGEDDEDSDSPVLASSIAEEITTAQPSTAEPELKGQEETHRSSVVTTTSTTTSSPIASIHPTTTASVAAMPVSRSSPTASVRDVAPTSPNNISSSMVAEMLFSGSPEVCGADGFKSGPASATSPSGQDSEHDELIDTNNARLAALNYTKADSSVSASHSSNARFNATTSTEAPSAGAVSGEYRPPTETTSSADQTRANATHSERSRTSSSSVSPQASSPPMQDSFFKSVQKRMLMLESNASLSLQYIEEQSRALRDAFKKVEQRQLAKTTTFLDYLNSTVLIELREFRLQYDQLWQSTVIELEVQRERYQQENFAIHARLGILADEVIFQKRMAILQMVLIAICLVLVLFSRGSFSRQLGMPMVHSMLARSPSSRWTSITSFDASPQTKPPIARSNSRPGSRQGILKGHRRMQSEDSVTSTVTPSDLYSPPTPVSFADPSEVEAAKEELGLDDLDFDPSTIERPSTSPPTLGGAEMPIMSSLDGFLDDRAVESRPMTPLSRSESEQELSKLNVEQTPPLSKHLTWQLPDG